MWFREVSDDGGTYTLVVTLDDDRTATKDDVEVAPMTDRVDIEIGNEGIDIVQRYHDH